MPSGPNPPFVLSRPFGRLSVQRLARSLSSIHHDYISGSAYAMPHREHSFNIFMSAARHSKFHVNSWRTHTRLRTSIKHSYFNGLAYESHDRDHPFISMSHTARPSASTHTNISPHTRGQPYLLPPFPPFRYRPFSPLIDRTRTDPLPFSHPPLGTAFPSNSYIGRCLPFEPIRLHGQMPSPRTQ